MKKDEQPKAAPERVRDEVYGLRLEDVIADAKKTEAKRKPAPPPDGAEAPAWPSLDELQSGKGQGRGPKPSRRR